MNSFHGEWYLLPGTYFFSRGLASKWPANDRINFAQTRSPSDHSQLSLFSSNPYYFRFLLRTRWDSGSGGKLIWPRMHFWSTAGVMSECTVRQFIFVNSDFNTKETETTTRQISIFMKRKIVRRFPGERHRLRGTLRRRQVRVGSKLHYPTRDFNLIMKLITPDPCTEQTTLIWQVYNICHSTTRLVPKT